MATIINGKLFENGKEVKPEFGNPSHIAALRREGAYRDTNETEVKTKVRYREHVQYSAEVSFVCECGTTHVLEGDHEDNERDAKEEFCDSRACKCGIIWGVEYDDKAKDILAKREG